MKPTRCIDPVIKYCQRCKYGHNIYPDDVETSVDLDGCCFDTVCIYGFENDEPTPEEIEEFRASKYASNGNGDYGPSNPWDAPGMSIRDFI